MREDAEPERDDGAVAPSGKAHSCPRSHRALTAPYAARSRWAFAVEVVEVGVVDGLSRLAEEHAGGRELEGVRDTEGLTEPLGQPHRNRQPAAVRGMQPAAGLRRRSPSRLRPFWAALHRGTGTVHTIPRPA